MSSKNKQSLGIPINIDCLQVSLVEDDREITFELKVKWNNIVDGIE